jgi:hypothetical protein
VQNADRFRPGAGSNHLVCGKAGIGEEKRTRPTKHFGLFPDDGSVLRRPASKLLVPAKESMVGVQGMVKKVFMRAASQTMEIRRVIETPVYREIRAHFFKHLFDFSDPMMDRDSRHRAASIRQHVHVMSPVRQSPAQSKRKVLCPAPRHLKDRGRKEDSHHQPFSMTMKRRKAGKQLMGFNRRSNLSRTPHRESGQRLHGSLVFCHL